MGGKFSCCCHRCSTNPRKYSQANIDETQAVTNVNFSDLEQDNGLETNNNKLHVSIIYGGDEEEKIPSDDPTSSTIFGQMLQQNKETSVPASKNFKVPSFNSNDRSGDVTKSTLKHSNSCSTIYIDDSTVSQPNLRAMIKCVSIAIHSHIVLRKSNKTMNIFDEKLHPLTKDPVPNDYDRQVPEQRNVYRFLRILFHSAQLTAECAIVALVYLERVLSYGELDLCPSNWKRLVLGAVMLASKVWDDQAVWNVDFCQILKDIRVSDMNELEREYVQLLQFNVNVGSSIYAKYYFDLRQLAKEHQISFPDELLTKEKAIKLEASSIATARSETTTSHGNSSKGTSMNIGRNPNGSATIKRSVSMELPQSSRKSLLIIS